MTSNLVMKVSDLPPTPERLFQLLDILKTAGFKRLFVDWGDLFPWSFEPRAASPYAYSEDALAGLAAQAVRLGLELCVALPLPLCFPPLWTCPGYRSLFRGGPGGLFDAQAPGLSKKCEAIIDDVLSLMPGCSGFLLGMPVLPGPAARPDLLPGLVSYVEKAGKQSWVANPYGMEKPVAGELPSPRKLVLLPPEQALSRDCPDGGCALYSAGRPGRVRLGGPGIEFILHRLPGCADAERGRSLRAEEAWRDLEKGLAGAWRLVRQAEEVRAAALVEARLREAALHRLRSIRARFKRLLEGLAGSRTRFELSLGPVCQVEPLQRFTGAKLVPLRAALMHLEAELVLLSGVELD